MTKQEADAVGKAVSDLIFALTNQKLAHLPTPEGSANGTGRDGKGRFQAHGRRKRGRPSRTIETTILSSPSVGEVG